MRSTGRFVRRHWASMCVVAVTLILYAVAWPTLRLTHEVSPQVMPLLSAAAVFPMLLVWVRSTGREGLLEPHDHDNDR